MDRVKTLHPKVHGGILHIRDKRPSTWLSVGEARPSKPIDMVVGESVCLLKRQRSAPASPFVDVIEKTSISVALPWLRSAAKKLFRCGNRDLSG